MKRGVHERNQYPNCGEVDQRRINTASSWLWYGRQNLIRKSMLELTSVSFRKNKKAQNEQQQVLSQKESEIQNSRRLFPILNHKRTDKRIQSGCCHENSLIKTRAAGIAVTNWIVWSWNIKMNCKRRWQILKKNATITSAFVASEAAHENMREAR